MEDDKLIRCLAVGDGYVGKTSLLARLAYTDAEFGRKYAATIFDNYSTKIDYGNQQYQVHFFDTAGQEEYKNIRINSYHNIDVFLVCFSVENAASFSNVTDLWIPEIREFANNACILLIGTKSDLRNDPETIDRMNISQENYVSYKMATDLAKRYNSRYIECSSQTGDNIEKIKNAIIESVLQAKSQENRPLFKCVNPACDLIRRVLCCRLC